MSEIVIFGTRNFAEIAHYYFTHDSPHRVVAFTVDGQFVESSSFAGLPVVPFEELADKFPPAGHGMFVAVGHQQLNSQREAKVAAAEQAGYELVSFVSTKADVAPDFVLQPNTMIMERATLQPFVRVGRDSIIWSTTRIGFHTQIGDHCWVVCALFGESCVVGDNTFVGLNATIAPGSKLGRGNIIGAGALITKDTKDFEIYRGQASTPSRVPSTRLKRI
ncbi:MAG: acetyltransferase [Planctomycetia bacterium]|mgnify:CR=1 FL=1|nr:acetyltransferase [Planctomycetia bacterium]